MTPTPDYSPPFADLTPDAVLNALDALGFITTGQLLTLNSYENRVFQIGVEGQNGQQDFVVAKFYRPQRWSDAQIEEEHAFSAELVAAEVTAVPPLVVNDRTLHHVQGHRCAVFARRGGRAPNIDDSAVLEWIGRYLGRLHSVGRAKSFVQRPALDIDSFGVEPRQFLLTNNWLPPELSEVYAGVSQHALDEVQRAFERLADMSTLRLHGDVHEGNVLWYDGLKENGPHFVDLDDSRSGPAIQDLWMLLGQSRSEQTQRLLDLLAGYEEFAEFDRRELSLIEALRTLRLMHYSAWIARRWHDPAFPAAFPWFNTPRYWEERILELREQIAAMQEEPLVV